VIDPKDLSQKSDALHELLNKKLGLRGATLSTRLRKAVPSLPKRLKKPVHTILEAQTKASHPKLARLIDPTPVEAAFTEITSFLNGLDRSEQRKTTLLNWLAGQVFNLILVAVLLVLLLRWQDLV